AATGESGVEVLINRGTGRFGTPVEYRLAVGGLETIHAGDLNGDAAPDLVVGAFYVLLNRGDGTLELTDSYPGDESGIEVADLNGDDRPDLITGYNEKSIFVYPNDGNGGFPTGRSFTAGHRPYDLLDVEDMNGDNKPDLITESVGSVKPGIWIGLNRGDGRFGRRHRYETGAGYLADVNGDGRPDFVSGYFPDGAEDLGPLSIRLNR